MSDIAFFHPSDYSGRAVNQRLRFLYFVNPSVLAKAIVEGFGLPRSFAVELENSYCYQLNLFLKDNEFYPARGAGQTFGTGGSMLLDLYKAGALSRFQRCYVVVRFELLHSDVEGWLAFNMSFVFEFVAVDGVTLQGSNNVMALPYEMHQAAFLFDEALINAIENTLFLPLN